MLTLDWLSKWDKDEKWKSNQPIFILTEALAAEMKFGENSLVSSFPPWPDTELPGFAAISKELGPLGCKGNWGRGGGGALGRRGWGHGKPSPLGLGERKLSPAAEGSPLA